MNINRKAAMAYCSFAVDDSGNPRRLDEIPTTARLVGWQCGFEPLFVAVWSYLPGITLDESDAEELATDLLRERGWFGDAGERDADYII